MIYAQGFFFIIYLEYNIISSIHASYLKNVLELWKLMGNTLDEFEEDLFW